MSVVPEALQAANQQLVALSGRYAEGEVDRQAFRQARRQLICETLGLEVPEVPDAHDQLDLPGDDDTMPGAPADGGHQSASREESAPDDGGDELPPAEQGLAVGEEAEQVSGTTFQSDPVKVKDSTLQVTLLLLLLAFVGLGGLLWFVLR